MRKHSYQIIACALFVTLACLSAQAQLPSTPPDHIVIVIEENHSFSEIIGNSSAPYINSLAQQGALFTNSFAIEHPSEPNYLDIFSGANQGVTNDNCPVGPFSAANLGSLLIGAGKTFKGFSEDLPSAGSTVCTSGAYARKHNPWVDFSNVPSASNQPFTSFPTDFTTLPTISFVIPNLNDDMHDGTISQADTWLKNHLDPYVQFAKTHNSLLIVTWDEDDSSASNQIPTIFFGPMVKQGQFGETIDHFNVLRTLEDLYGLSHAGQSANASPITDVWQTTNPDFSLSASPASLSIKQGSSGTSTITVNPVNGFSGSVSLSASGLPAGVTASFNPSSTTSSSTLTLTASSTATTGATTVTVTGTSGSLTHTVNISLTVSSAAATQLLGNPGFENGTNTAPWSLTPAVINGPNSTQEPPHSGAWDAWLDGYGTNHTDTATQTVTIPSTATSATLSFWLHIDTAETTTTTAFDTLQVQVLNTSGTVLATLGTFSNLNHAAGYQQHSFSVLQFKGQTVQIRFVGTEDSSLQTSFVIDDTALNVQ